MNTDLAPHVALTCLLSPPVVFILKRCSILVCLLPKSNRLGLKNGCDNIKGSQSPTGIRQRPPLEFNGASMVHAYVNWETKPQKAGQSVNTFVTSPTSPHTAAQCHLMKLELRYTLYKHPQGTQIISSLTDVCASHS